MSWHRTKQGYLLEYLRSPRCQLTGGDCFMDKLDQISKEIQEWIELRGTYVYAANDYFLDSLKPNARNFNELRRKYEELNEKADEIYEIIKKLTSEYERIADRRREKGT